MDIDVGKIEWINSKPRANRAGFFIWRFVAAKELALPYGLIFS